MSVRFTSSSSRFSFNGVQQFRAQRYYIGFSSAKSVKCRNAEGAAIYAIASQDLSSGVAFAVGVGMRNAPMGMLLYSAMERNRARGIVVLAIAALSPFVGGLLLLALGDVINEAVLDGVVCVALGMIAYMLLAELLPTMIRKGNLKRSVIGTAVGVAFVLIGSLFDYRVALLQLFAPIAFRCDSILADCRLSIPDSRKPEIFAMGFRMFLRHENTRPPR